MAAEKENLPMPRATIEVKELRVDISKDGGSKPTLFVKLYRLLIVVHLGDPRVSYDRSSNLTMVDTLQLATCPLP